MRERKTTRGERAREREREKELREGKESYFNLLNVFCFNIGRRYHKIIFKLLKE